MAADTGLISLKHEGLFYTLHFRDQGWVALELLQFIDTVIEAQNRPAAILKLLGYTLHISPEVPRKNLDCWAIVDLGNKVLETNSDLVRRAIDQGPPAVGSRSPEAVLRRIYEVLDRHDFTVKFYR